ncbi:MAG: SusC/RagA family TonB-linked outer membrane protein [Gemmatimonadota bacterium]
MQLGAQTPTGTVVGRVVDGTTQQPISGASVTIVGTTRGTLTEANGRFALTGIAAGSQTVMASLIGYASVQQTVTVTAGASVSVQFSLQPEAVALEALVATGYGAQRRLAITGSISTVDAEAADVGVISNANEMIQGRVSGVNVTVNNGEPGAGAQIRIRGGTSISASNEPLYVIDGVPIENVPTEPSGIGIGGNASLPRSPLNLINPSDIASITILKDASAAAIYGSRGANGVILIETKKGGGSAAGSGISIEYDGYVASAAPATKLEFLSGDQYRQFIQQQVDVFRASGGVNGIAPERLSTLGTANTNWQDAVTRTSTTHNHNLSFAGGGASTRYRASLNYMNQQGVALSSGFERLQGRLSASHNAWSDRLRLGLNLTASHIDNDYLAFENGGGFEGGVFVNMAIFNPTRPVTLTDPSTGQPVYYELGTGSQSVRNPVALADQIQDFAETTRTLGNVRAELDLLSNVTGTLNIGVDRSEGTRRTYFPRANPVGAVTNGLARQVNRDNTAMTLQGLLTFRDRLLDMHDVEVIGGYEYNDYSLGEFMAGSKGFLTDAFGFNNLGGGSSPDRPFSWREDSRLISFFSRANYDLNDRYFVTGVLRYDGSSRFGAGNKWALFPAISGSWRISEENFFNAPLGLSELRLRAGWGLQGNQAVSPYASLILLETAGNARAVFGEGAFTGFAPVRNPNPNLKWEETSQLNVAFDYGFKDNKYSGSLEYYVKNTTDLLLEVNVPQPAPVATRIENIGEVRNKGLEVNFDARVLDRADMNWTAGLVLSVERNEVVDLGGRTFITSGFVSGQGQSGQTSQRIMPGQPLGTFFGPEYVGVNPDGRQLFNKYSVERDAKGNVVSRELIGETTTPSGDDFVVIGNANPDFSLGLRSQVNWGKLDVNFLIRSEVGRDVFNNTSLVYGTKGNALQDKNFLVSALDDPIGLKEPAIFSSRWIEDGSFVRLQNITVGYTMDLPQFMSGVRNTRVYLSADNLLLLTGYSGYDPEVHTSHGGLAVRGIDYLVYPRARTITAGVRVAF